MTVVTQNVVVEITKEESDILSQANEVLLDLIDTLRKQNLENVYIRDFAREYDIENLENAKDLLFDLANEVLELE